MPDAAASAGPRASVSDASGGGVRVAAGATVLEEDTTIRLRIDLAYDGAGFKGWAAQPGLRTVEGVLTEALETIFRVPVRVTVAGRTDSGVHAAAQTAHVDVPRHAWLTLPGRSDRRPGDAALSRLAGVLAHEAERAAGERLIAPLPRGASDVVVRAVEEVSGDFDARFSALSRRYRYRIDDGWRAESQSVALAGAKVGSDGAPGSSADEAASGIGSHPDSLGESASGVGNVLSSSPESLAAPGATPPALLPPYDPRRRGHVLWLRRSLNLEAMQEAAAALLGEHDFLSYCKPREGATTIRTLRRLEWSRPLAGPDVGLLVLDVEADAFCHSMVRSLVGVSIAVGQGRRPVSWPGELLRKPSRTVAAPVAPPHGLTLEEVVYPAVEQYAAQARQARVLRSLPDDACADCG